MILRVHQVELRAVHDEDVVVFYDHQLDPDATHMAGFPARDEAGHHAHWAKIRADETIIARTVLVDGRVAGNIVSWEQDGERRVGYWIGRAHWGAGATTKALAAFCDEVTVRPLYAHVARHNAGSIRVLEKCGFAPCGETPAEGDDPGELVFCLT